ncbi:zinc finger, CCHC-type containing protein [Tanacetum coccineum]
MATTAQNTNNTTIRSILQQEKLTVPNFINWYQNLRIVLRSEGKLAHLEQPLIPLPLPDAPQAVRDTYEVLNDAQNEVACLMLGSMSPDIQREEGQSVSSYLLKMKSYLDTLEHLGYAMPNKLGIQKDKWKPRGAKGKDKGKNKLAYAPKPKIPLPHKRGNPAKDSICHHCKEMGHWRRNCSSYQVKLKKRKEASMASTLAVEAIGSFDLILHSGLIIVLDNCHFAPTVTGGFVSISCLVENGYIHTFTNYGISVSKDNVFYFNAIPHDGIYEIDMHNLYPNVSYTFNVSNKRVKYYLDSSYLWHCRLGHINKKRMDKLQRDGILHPTHDESLKKCKSCIFGKMARKPFPHKVERAKDLLGLIHTDVCGPFRTVSREGASYFITFTDDFSRYGYVYLMKHKDGIFETFKKVERTPNERWHGKAPKLSYLRVWGCETLVKRDAPDKLDPRSIKCIFVGYPKETMGYYFYYPPENKIFVTRNVKFFEDNLIVQEASGSHGPLKMSGSDEGLKIIQEEDTQPSENTSEEHNEVVPMEYELGDLNEPPNYKAALSYPEYDKWLEAMNTEMQSIKDNQVWILVELPPNGQTVESKWIFKKKTDMDGNIHTFKARLVAKGYTNLRLKQASRSWNKRFDEEIKKIGFTQNPDEPCVYLKASGSSVAFLVLYVDDILLVGNNVTMLQEAKSWLFVFRKILSDRDDTKSQTRYVFVLNGGAVDWKSAKQSTTTMSSIESEYIVAAEASMEAVWMRKFINGLDDVVSSNQRPMGMRCDNEPAIAIVADLGILKGARHFQRKYHYIREVI